MSYETAYSTEINQEDITALEANQMFFDGILTDSHAFQCSKDCTYPLTCKSFTKKSTEWKKAPHFSPGKNHVNSLHTCNQEQKSSFSKANPMDDALSTTIDKHNNDLKLNISLNSGFNDPVISNTNKDSKTELPLSYTKHTNKKNTTTQNEGVQINSLIRLIHYYHSEEYPNNQTFFTTLDNKKINLDYLFFDLNKNFSIPNDVRVFFGKAYLTEKDHYFIIRITNYCNLDGVRSKPSILIPRYLLNNKIKFSKKFDRLSGQKFTFFYFGRIVVSDGKYLNFEAPNKDRVLANLYLKD